MTKTDRADVFIRLVIVRIVFTAAKHFCFGFQLNVEFKADYSLEFHKKKEIKGIKEIRVIKEIREILVKMDILLN